MDLFEELEKMALNVGDEQSEDETPFDTIHRWQMLFGYSRTDAVTLIERHRNDISRRRVTDEHWDMVREKLELQGYDRESYEHELTRGGEKVKIAKDQEKTVDSGQYLVKLEGLITPKLIQELSETDEGVKIIRGSGDDEEANFCIVNSTIKDGLFRKLSSIGFQPMIVRLSKPASKNLSSTSRYPSLGLDTTLPQNRPSIEEKDFLPAQDQYPVWYFFYGTLADPFVLSRHLGLTNEPILWPASIRGGILKTWAGKYRALVDGPKSSVIEGSAFEVQSREQEDTLRSYETSKYEVVRCMIEIGYRRIPGCTFRFVGSVDD